MRLHVVGTGCPAPLAEWYGSAFVLETGDDVLMIDCGPAATYKMARMGMEPGQVRRIFLTHHHFDHNADLPCFALTWWDQSRGTETLSIYGPPPTRAFVERLFGREGAFFDDWHSRIEHPVSQRIHTQRGGALPRPAPKIEAHEIEGGLVAESPSWRVSAARVRHVDPWLVSLAYRIETDEGRILFAGDCADCPELRQIAQGVDTLVIGCVFIGRSEQTDFYSEVITGTPEVAAIVNGCGIGRVVLTHLSPGFTRPGVKEQAVADVARSFDGEILIPDELTSVDLS